MQLNLNLHSNSPKETANDETLILGSLDRHIRQFPSPHQEFLPGIRWGDYGRLFTPAYWKVQYLLHNYNGNFGINYRLGKNILEEVVACLLGGFGLKSEIGLAAFARLKERQQIKERISFSAVSQSLQEPFNIREKMVQYRFPNQKAKFIYRFLNRSDLRSRSFSSDLAFRTWLLSVDGIGPKTASWITRNYLDSENVAIIDIHIFRACRIMGLFSSDFDVQKDYFKLERIFLQFCKELDVQPSKMDALMWLQMKQSNKTALKVIFD